MRSKEELQKLEITELVSIMNEQVELNLNEYQKKGWKANVEMEQVELAMLNGGYIDSWEDRFSVYKPIENSEGSRFVFNLGKKKYLFIKECLERFGKLTEMFCHIRLELDKDKLIDSIIIATK